MTIQIVESARDDINGGWQFYEAQQQGLGDYFLSSIKAEIESLRICAGVHSKTYADYHRLVCRRFPFAIFYTCSAAEVIIYAVIDCRRDPLWVYKHLQNSG